MYLARSSPTVLTWFMDASSSGLQRPHSGTPRPPGASTPSRSYVPYKDPYDVQSREDRPAPDPVAPAPQELAENPLLAECEELIEVRVTIERLEKRVTELDAENAALR